LGAESEKLGSGMKIERLEGQVEDLITREGISEEKIAGGAKRLLVRKNSEDFREL